MGRRFLLALVVLLTTVVGLFAVQSGFQAMTIVRASQKTRDRVIYYVVNTPLYREDPYFEVEVSVNGTNILAEYEPRDAWEMLPEPWKAGTRRSARSSRSRAQSSRAESKGTVCS